MICIALVRRMPVPRSRSCSRPGPSLWLVAAFGLLRVLDAQVNNYPAPVARPMWCSVPNYRYYKLTLTQARGFAESDSLTCGLTEGKPDGCSCVNPSDCRAGYCVPDTLGASRCIYPIVQLSEIEFWRRGQKVNTRRIPDDAHDGFRVVNGVDVPQTWGVWELEFHRDTTCGDRVVGGTVIASSQRSRGFGHSADHTAPLGAVDPSRTCLDSLRPPPTESFQLHGPAHFAVDGDLTTNWWPSCENPCRARTEWIGLEYTSIVTGGMKCVRIIQDRDRDYASFSLIVQGRLANGSGWQTFSQFNAATWEWGGVWERLSIPQGVAFRSSSAHARLLDSDLNSSVVEIIGTPIEFDFGVETEVDGWHWATAEEPSDNNAREHDGYTCDLDGLCPRDPVQWTLEGSLDRSTWVTITDQSQPYRVTIYRKRWVPIQSVTHEVSISIEDVWPDGRGACAARR